MSIGDKFMKKVMLSGSTILCGLVLFYLSRFQTSYYMNEHLLMTFLTFLTIALICLHVKVYRK